MNKKSTETILQIKFANKEAAWQKNDQIKLKIENKITEYLLI